MNTHSIDLEAGSSHYLTAADSTSLSITGDISIELWVKIESAPVNFAYILISKHDFNGNQRSYDLSYRYNGGTPRLELLLSSDGTSTNQVQHNEDVDLGTGTWKHIAVTVNFTSNEVKFYVDGAQEGTTKTESTINAIFDGSASFIVGSYLGTSNFFDGLVDEVRVWSDERTAAEISANYQTELVGNEANLVAYYDFDGSSLLDVTSNNNDLTNPNSAAFSTDVPFTGATSGSGLLLGR